MNKEKKTVGIHNGIWSFTLGVMLFLAEFYSQLASRAITLGGLVVQILHLPQGSVLSIFLDFLVDFLLFGGLSTVAYFSVKYISKLIWKIKNKHIYIAGDWLHIHDKINMRIGVVHIEQDFYNLEVDAENIKPANENSKATKWHYIGSAFHPEQNAQIQLMGCYFGQRTGDASKQGVHLFRIFEREGNKVWKMTGEFGDALSVLPNQTVVEAADRTGKILLFKMTPALKKYLNYSSVTSYDHHALTWILQEQNNENIQNEPFVKELRQIYLKNALLERLAELTAQREPCFAVVADTVCNVLVHAMYADKVIDIQERSKLRQLTGYEWTDRQLSQVRTLSRETILGNVSSLLASVQDRDVSAAIATLLNETCRSIILCNTEIHDREQAFLDELETVTSAYL